MPKTLWLYLLIWVMKRVVDEVIKAYGRIDILVNNAAVQYESDSLEEIDDATLQMVFRTNIFSYFFMTK